MWFNHTKKKKKLLYHIPNGSDNKESACSAGDPSSIPGSGSSTGEGNGHPLQYSCLENSMDRGDWQATVHGVTENQAPLSNLHFQNISSSQMYFWSLCVILCSFSIVDIVIYSVFFYLHHIPCKFDQNNYYGNVTIPL